MDVCRRKDVPLSPYNATGRWVVTPGGGYTFPEILPRYNRAGINGSRQKQSNSVLPRHTRSFCLGGLSTRREIDKLMFSGEPVEMSTGMKTDGYN